jgi:preprotein translocase subunit SecD
MSPRSPSQNGVRSIVEVRKVVSSTPPSPSGATSTPSFPGRHERRPSTADPNESQQIEDARKILQGVDLTDQTATQAKLAQLDCATLDPLVGHDDPRLTLLTCNADDSEKFALEPAILTNEDIVNAVAGTDPNGSGSVINVTFNGSGSDIWAKFTAANVNQQAAFIIDGVVLIAPTINGPIPNGTTTITGHYDKQQAEQLAAKIIGR